MKEKFIRFMQGRYGVDQLSKFLLVIGFIVVIVSYFVVCLENRKQGCSHFVLFDFTNFFHRVAHFVHFGLEIARPLVKKVQT